MRASLFVEGVVKVRAVWIASLCVACGGTALSAPRAADTHSDAPPVVGPEAEEIAAELEEEDLPGCDIDPSPLELGLRDLVVEATRDEGGRSILRIASRLDGEVESARCDRASGAGELPSEVETRIFSGWLDQEHVVVVLERARSATRGIAIAWVLDMELRFIDQVAVEGAGDAQVYSDVLVLGEHAYALRDYELVDVGPPPPLPPARERAAARLSEMEGYRLDPFRVHELHPATCDTESIEGIYVFMDGEEGVIADLLVHLIDGGQERWLPWAPGELYGIIDGASIEVQCVQCDGAGPPELLVRQRDYRGSVERWNDLPQADVEHVEIVRLEAEGARTLVHWRTGAQPIPRAPYFAHRARIELGGAAPLRVVRERARGARAREGRALVEEGSYACGPEGVVRLE